MTYFSVHSLPRTMFSLIADIQLQVASFLSLGKYSRWNVRFILMLNELILFIIIQAFLRLILIKIHRRALLLVMFFYLRERVPLFLRELVHLVQPLMKKLDLLFFLHRTCHCILCATTLIVKTERCKYYCIRLFSCFYLFFMT